MADFEPAFARMLRNEGGLKLHTVKGDRGGQTYGGIARNRHPGWPGWAYFDRGETAPTELVRRFYKDEFWNVARLDHVIHQRTAESLFDFGVNAGMATAVRLAQIVVGTVADGIAGPKTIAALNVADPERFSTMYALAKIARYRDIVTKDRSQLQFLLGWINRTLREAS